MAPPTSNMLLGWYTNIWARTENAHSWKMVSSPRRTRDRLAFAMSFAILARSPVVKGFGNERAWASQVVPRNDSNAVGLCRNKAVYTPSRSMRRQGLCFARVPLFLIAAQVDARTGKGTRISLLKMELRDAIGV